MTKRTVHQEYLKKQTAEVAVFVSELRDHGTNKEGTFDSAAADDFMATAINQNNTGVKVPENLKIVLDEMPLAFSNSIRLSPVPDARDSSSSGRAEAGCYGL